MNYSSRIVKVIIDLALIVVLNSCASFNSEVELETLRGTTVYRVGSQMDISHDELGTLLGYNFQQGLSELPCFIPGSVERPAGNGEYILSKREKACSIHSRIENRTEKENWILGVRQLPDGQWDSLVLFISKMNVFYNEYDRLPYNGLELCYWIQDSSDVETFHRMDEINKYVSCRFGINPITGKFFRSFDNAKWHPGGVFVEVITDGEAIHNAYPNLKIIKDYMQPITENNLTSPDHVLRFTVFGENVDTILYQEYSVS